MNPREAADIPECTHLKWSIVLGEDAIRIRWLTSEAVNSPDFPVAEIRGAQLESWFRGRVFRRAAPLHRSIGGDLRETDLVLVVTSVHEIRLTFADVE